MRLFLEILVLGEHTKIKPSSVKEGGSKLVVVCCNRNITSWLTTDSVQRGAAMMAGEALLPRFLGRETRRIMREQVAQLLGCQLFLRGTDHLILTTIAVSGRIRKTVGIVIIHVAGAAVGVSKGVVANIILDHTTTIIGAIGPTTPPVMGTGDMIGGTKIMVVDVMGKSEMIGTGTVIVALTIRIRGESRNGTVVRIMMGGGIEIIITGIIRTVGHILPLMIVIIMGLKPILLLVNIKRTTIEEEEMTDLCLACRLMPPPPHSIILPARSSTVRDREAKNIVLLVRHHNSESNQATTKNCRPSNFKNLRGSRGISRI